MNMAVIILAAGKGTRMKSDTVKVLHPLAARPMLAYSLDLACAMKPEKLAVVVGCQADRVREAFADYSPPPAWAVQPHQRGTADAVRVALPLIKDAADTVLVLYGDVPLLKQEVLEALLKQHALQKACITILTAELENPYGYGRIVRDRAGRILRIVEEADTQEEEKKIREINTGIYAIHIPFLLETIDGLNADNAQGEYYLTDIVGLAVSKGLPVGWSLTDEPACALGINTRKDLAEAERILRLETCSRWMLEGVTIVDPFRTQIDPSVTLDRDVRIEPDCHLQGNTHIGRGSVIEAGNMIRDSRIGCGVQVRPYCVIQDSRVGDEARVGPMAHLRPGTVLEQGALVGNFVEVKKTRVGQGSKAAHLTYLGDTEIGRDVNIGCGTITCNYDGEEKHKTVIEDKVFVGSDTQLIAPVRVGKGAYIGSGSTITEDVPSGALALGRSRQRVIEGWAKRKKPGKQGKEKAPGRKNQQKKKKT